MSHRQSLWNGRLLIEPRVEMAGRVPVAWAKAPGSVWSIWGSCAWRQGCGQGSSRPAHAASSYFSGPWVGVRRVSRKQLATALSKVPTSTPHLGLGSSCSVGAGSARGLLPKLTWDPSSWSEKQGQADKDVAPREVGLYSRVYQERGNRSHIGAPSLRRFPL